MGTRWMAPESQPDSTFDFSEQSEVYTFGVVIWELFSEGGVPYDTVGNNQIGAAKRQGMTPDVRQATRATPAVIELMRLCWEPMAANRPSWSEVQAMLVELIASDGERLRPTPPVGAIYSTTVTGAIYMYYCTVTGVLYCD